MTLLSSFAGYGLWFFALSRGGIRRIGSLQLAMPMITLALAVLILDEELTWLLMVCCAVIIAGTYLAQRYAR
jgi:drug/metabolite transporter (DMT)-like permease